MRLQLCQQAGIGEAVEGAVAFLYFVGWVGAVSGLEGGDEGGLLMLGGFFGREGTLAIDGEVAFGIDGGVV